MFPPPGSDPPGAALTFRHGGPAEKGAKPAVSNARNEDMTTGDGPARAESGSAREVSARAEAGRAEAGRRREQRPPWRQPRPAGDGSPDRFGLLLITLVSVYLLSAFLTGRLVSVFQLALFLLIAALAARAGRLGRHTRHLAVAIGAGGTAVAITLAITHSADAGAGVANLWAAMMLLFAAALIVRRVLSYPEVTQHSIYGAVSAYMVIGLMFAALYGAMYRFGGNTFFANGSPGNIKTFQYFSFTTLTTLGYGDFTAAGNGGRAVAMIEALGGQVFLATLVARLVAAFRAPIRRQRRGEPAGPGQPGPGGGPGGADAGGGGPAEGPTTGVKAPRRGPRPATAQARRMSSRARARRARRSPPRPER